MKNYTIYFEFFSRNMKTQVMAESEEEAKEIIKNKIKFHKVEKSNDEFNKAIDLMDDMLNFLGGKRS